jgi:hypothetical protein
MPEAQVVGRARVLDLAAEARHFHACLFRRPPDAITVARYEAAHLRWFDGAPQSAAIAEIVERKLDAEAIEFALRRRGANSRLAAELTRKLEIVCYLAEVRAAYAGEFINFESSRVRAWSTLAFRTLRAGWKLAKGEYLIRRRGLL